MKRIFLIVTIGLLKLSVMANLSENTKFYGSFYTALLTEEGNYSIVDNGSRAGIKFEKKEFYPHWNAGLRGEYGINSTSRPSEFQIKNNSLTSSTTNGPFSNRLGYMYFTYKDNLKFSFGKQWSPFYDVTSVTDIYAIFGAQAAGAFSLSSDGGYLGTGRADNSAVASYKSGNLETSLIYVATGNQSIEILDANGDSLPGKPTRIYKRSFGGALQYTSDTLTLGVANMTGHFLNDEKEEHSHSTTFGAKYVFKDLTIAGVYTISRLAEIDNNGVIFGANGVEAIIKYHLSEDVSLSAGLNSLKPDDKTYDLVTENDYTIEKYIFALTLEKDFFTLALEGVSDLSRNADGSRTSENIIGLSLGLSL